MFKRCFVVLFALLCSPVFGDSGDLRYQSTDKIYSKDTGGSFTLMLSSDGLVYHKVSASISPLWSGSLSPLREYYDGYFRFLVLGEDGEKIIGRGECDLYDFYHLGDSDLFDDSDFFLKDVMACSMRFVDRHNREIKLTKYIDDEEKVLLFVEGVTISHAGKVQFEADALKTDNLSDYYYCCA